MELEEYREHLEKFFKHRGVFASLLGAVLFLTWTTTLPYNPVVYGFVGAIFTLIGSATYYIVNKDVEIYEFGLFRSAMWAIASALFATVFLISIFQYHTKPTFPWLDFITPKVTWHSIHADDFVVLSLTYFSGMWIVDKMVSFAKQEED